MDPLLTAYLIGILPTFLVLPYVLGRFTDFDDDDAVPMAMFSFLGAGLWPLLFVAVIPWLMFKLGIWRATRGSH